MPDSIAPHATINADCPEDEVHRSENKTSSMLIFSYGAGMLSSVIRQRCPDAEYYATAQLVDHELCFSRWDKSRSGYVAGLRQRPEKMLWGVLWRIPRAQIDNLDEFEGYRPDRPINNNYVRIPVVVRSATGDLISAETYKPAKEEKDGRPNRNYRNSLLAGALENGLPREYIKHLKKTPYASNPLPSTLDAAKLRGNRIVRYCLQHPPLVGASLYLYVSLLGVMYNSIVMVNRGFNPVGYYHINDFLLGGLRHPYILILIVVAICLSGIYGATTISLNYLIELFTNAEGIRRHLLRSRLGSILLNLLGSIHWAARLAVYWVLFAAMILLLGLPIFLPAIASDGQFFTRKCEAHVTISTKQETFQMQPLADTKEINKTAKSDTISGLLIGSTELYIFVSDDPEAHNTQKYVPTITRILPVDEIGLITVVPSYANPLDRWVCLALR